MDADYFTFEWPVWSDEYEWLHERVLPKPEVDRMVPMLHPDGPRRVVPKYGAKEWLLTDRRPAVGVRSPLRTYNPLDSGALHLEFASTAPTRDGIIGFARKYGLLGARAGTHFLDSEPRQTPAPHRIIRAELMTVWQTEILRMQHAVEFWNMLSAVERDARRMSRVKSHFRMSDSAVVYFSDPEAKDLAGHIPDPSDRNTPKTFVDSCPDCSLDDLRQQVASPSHSLGYEILIQRPTPTLIITHVIAAAHYKPDVLAKIKDEGGLSAGRYYLQALINESISGLVSPQFIWDVEEQIGGLRFVPTSLLGALWLQFASSVNGNVEFRTCLFCNAPMKIARDDDGHTKRRQYCSDTCRVRADRKRKKAKMSRLAARTRRRPLHAD